MLDIIAPSLMIGLAFGRMGCLLNGCCFGGACEPDWALAQRFPMYSRPLVNLGGGAGPFSAQADAPSPPFQHQLAHGDLHPDPRLLAFGARQPLPPRDLHGKLESDQTTMMFATQEQQKQAFEDLAGDDGLLDEREFRHGRRRGDGLLRGSEALTAALRFDRDGDRRLDWPETRAWLRSRRAWLVDSFDRDRDGLLDAPERSAASAWLQADTYALAIEAHSAPVRPAQVLGIVNALLLAAGLLVVGRIRTREGQVFAILMVSYPLTRFILEAVRADNPHDLAQGNLTHNQYTSLAITTIGIVTLIALRRLPASVGPLRTHREAGARS
jgi:hypothetical protein